MLDSKKREPDFGEAEDQANEKFEIQSILRRPFGTGFSEGEQCVIDDFDDIKLGSQVL